MNLQVQYSAGWAYFGCIIVLAVVFLLYLGLAFREWFRKVRSEAKEEEGYRFEVKKDPYINIRGEIRYRDSEDNTPMAEYEGDDSKVNEGPLLPKGMTGSFWAEYDKGQHEERLRKSLGDFPSGPIFAKLPDTEIEPIIGSLKTWPEYFQLQWDNEKPFEIRRNDRDFKEGQLYWLEEYRPDWTNSNPHEGQPFCSETGQLTGRKLLVRLQYVMHGPAFGLQDGWVAFGYTIISRIANGRDIDKDY